MIFTNLYTYLVFGALILVFMSAYLGSVRKFYDKYAWWDVLIHFLSGILFVSFGVALSNKIVGLSKLNMVFFSFTFAVTLHVAWEIAEYILDCKTHGNNQRWQKVHNSINHKSQTAIQPAGLVDTMNDTIFCTVSALLSSIVWWIIL